MTHDDGSIWFKVSKGWVNMLTRVLLIISGWFTELVGFGNVVQTSVKEIGNSVLWISLNSFFNNRIFRRARDFLILDYFFNRDMVAGDDA